MNPFRGLLSLCAAALVGTLIAAPAAFAELPGTAAGDAQSGQQLISDITVLTGLNRMRLAQGQMRDIVQRLSLLSHAEETYAEHETNTSQTALAAMRQVEKALQAGQEISPAAQTKVDAVLNPLKTEEAKVEQLHADTVGAIERDLHPEQLAALMDELGIQGQRAAAAPQTWRFRMEPGDPMPLPMDPNDAMAPPKGGDAPRILDLGTLNDFQTKNGRRIEDEGRLGGQPDGGPAIPRAATTPPPAGQTEAPAAPAGTAAPIFYDGLVPEGNEATATPPPTDVEFYTNTATTPAAIPNPALPVAGPQLLEVDETPPVTMALNPKQNDAPAQPEEDRAKLNAEQQAQIADLEERLQKLNAQTMDEIKMIRKTMAQLHIPRGPAITPPVGFLVTPLPMQAPPAVKYIPMMGGPGYAVGGGFQSQGGPYDEAIRRFFLQPNVLRFLKARLANQE